MKSLTLIFSILFGMSFVKFQSMIEHSSHHIEFGNPETTFPTKKSIELTLKIELKNPDQISIKDLELLIGRSDLLITYTDTTSYFDESNFSEHFKVKVNTIPLDILEVIE